MAGFPTVTTEVAFATLPGAAVPTWTDVSAFVKSMRVNGAHRQRELDAFEAGTLDLVLDNSDGRFNPNNAASPYSPNVLPMRRIRVRATWAAVVYDLFNGYVEDWPQSSNYPFEGAVSLKATDAFIALAAAPLAGSALEIEMRTSAPVAWWPLSDSSASDNSMVDVAGTFDGAYEGRPTSSSLVSGSSMAGTYFAHAEDQRGKYASIAGGPITAYPFTVECVVQIDETIDPDPSTTAMRRYIFQLRDTTTNGYGVTIEVIDDLGGAGSFGTGVGGYVGAFMTSAGQTRSVYSWRPIADGKPHHIMLVCASATSMVLYVDGLAGAGAAAGSPVFPTSPTIIAFGHRHVGAGTGVRFGLAGSVANGALYNTALSSTDAIVHGLIAFGTGWAGDDTGARVNRILDAAGWSAADRNISPGISTMQPAAFSGSALDALKAIAETENGAVFVTPAGQVRFRDRQALLRSPYTSPVATFSDQAAGVNYDEIEPDFAVDAIKNDAIVSRAGGVAQRYKDTTSIGKYFRRGYNKTGLLFQRDSEARDHAQWVVNRAKDPPFRYSKITLTPYGVEATLFPLMLGLAIGDRVTTTQQPPGTASPVSIDEHIEGITHTIAGTEWSTEFQLSPADLTSYFVLDTSSLGGASVLGY